MLWLDLVRFDNTSHNTIIPTRYLVPAVVDQMSILCFKNHETQLLEKRRAWPERAEPIHRDGVRGSVPWPRRRLQDDRRRWTRYDDLLNQPFCLFSFLEIISLVILTDLERSLSNYHGVCFCVFIKRMKTSRPFFVVDFWNLKFSSLYSFFFKLNSSSFFRSSPFPPPFFFISCLICFSAAVGGGQLCMLVGGHLKLVTILKMSLMLTLK